uniref:Uncharacterized protein n=1 Tax=Anguilla anguilla TaxID=7936 RepID=A0A0E9U5X8_ANGAN
MACNILRSSQSENSFSVYS